MGWPSRVCCVRQNSITLHTDRHCVHFSFSVGRSVSAHNFLDCSGWILNEIWTNQSKKTQKNLSGRFASAIWRVSIPKAVYDTRRRQQKFFFLCSDANRRTIVIRFCNIMSNSTQLDAKYSSIHYIIHTSSAAADLMIKTNKREMMTHLQIANQLQKFHHPIDVFDVINGFGCCIHLACHLFNNIYGMCWLWLFGSDCGCVCCRCCCFRWWYCDSGNVVQLKQTG